MSPSLSIAMALLPLGLILVLAVAGWVLRRTGGHARGWRLRCEACGRVRDAAELGIVRLGAGSSGKRVRVGCAGCGGKRWVHLERAATE